MRIYDIQNSFARGELSPRLHARTDIDHYRQALKECTNFVVLRQGTLAKRPGSRFVAEVKDSAKKTRLVPFVFSTEQAYVLEFGDLYMRIYANGGRVETGGSPVEIATPYPQADLFELQFAQSADTLFVAHKDHAPRKITRSSDTAWTVTPIEFEDGPFLSVDAETDVTLTADDDGNIVPPMTSNTAPSGTVTSGNSAATAYRCFDQDDTSFYFVDNTDSGWVAYEPTSPKVCNGYTLIASADAAPSTPSSWEFEGHDGSDWILLDTRRGENDWTSTEARSFEFNNTTAYDAYRFTWNDTGPTEHSYIGGLLLREHVDQQPAATITASGTAGINDGQGFLATDAGRLIRLQTSHSHWVWFRVTARTSSTQVDGVFPGFPLPDLTPIRRWRLGAWSDETGYPGSVTFFEDRLVWARSNAEPQKLWGSKTFAFEDHGVSSPLLDDDAFAMEVSSDQVNEIRWIVEASDLVLGTSSAIRTLGPSDTSKAFSASNLRQRRQTTIGSAALQPVAVGNVMLYADKIARGLRELFFSLEGDSFVAPELTILSEHLFASGIVALAFAGEPEPTVWIVTADGGLVSLTFERDQKIVGMARHRPGGSVAGPAVTESVVTIPGANASEVWLLVRRTIDGSTKRYVERLAPFFEGGAVAGARFLDSHLDYSGSETGTVTGLAHLEGETVGILADGVVLAPQTVAGAAVTLPGGQTASEIAVGLAYEAAVEQLRPAPGGNDGSLLGRHGATAEIILDVKDCLGLELAGEGFAQEVFERLSSEPFDQPMDLREGAFRTSLSPGWRAGGAVRVTSAAPLPAEIRAITRGLEIEP